MQDNKVKRGVVDEVRETYIVQVQETRNATWQGTVTWAEGRRKEMFRSALELLRLIDSSLPMETGGGKSEENMERESGESRDLRGTP